MRYHVFISYRRADEKIAERIETGLTKRRFVCFRDRQMPLGTEFPAYLQRAIRDSQALLIVLSPRVGQSEWVEREVEWAISEKRLVLPVEVGRAWLSESLAEKISHINRLKVSQRLDDRDLDKLAREMTAIGVGALDDIVDRKLQGEQLMQAFPALTTGDYERLGEISSLAYTYFRGTPGPGLWTVHGLRHANGIISTLHRILPEKMRESEKVCFCLAAAACLHDLGLAKARCQLVDRPVRSGEERGVDRATHHIEAERIVMDVAGELGFSPTEARTIAYVSRYHNARSNIQELTWDPELAQAAAYFRIANACDMGPFRAPPYFWHGKRGELGSDLTDVREQRATEVFWLRNLLAQDVSIDSEEHDIVVRWRVPTEEINFVPELFGRYLEALVDDLVPIVGRWRLDSSLAVCAPEEAPLSLHEMIATGAEVYADPDAVLRSSGELSDYFISAVLALSDPNHWARDRKLAGQARDTLDRIASSLPTRRPELHLLQYVAHQYLAATRNARSAPEALKAARQRFLSLSQDRKSRRVVVDQPQSKIETVAYNAFRELTETIHNGPSYTFLVFGQSGPVSVFIRYCLFAGKAIKVYTPLMRPPGEGRTLKLIEELQPLTQLRLPLEVELIPDGAIPYVLACGEPYGGSKREHALESGEATSLGQAHQGCDLALMGCEAMNLKGKVWVANSLGCVAFARMVKPTPTPLWVLTDEAKQFCDPDVSCWAAKPRHGVGSLPVTSLLFEPVASIAASTSQASYPRSEKMPGDLVDAVITEKRKVYPR